MKKLTNKIFVLSFVIAVITAIASIIVPNTNVLTPIYAVQNIVSNKVYYISSEDPRMANLPESLIDGNFLEFGEELALPVPELKVSSNLDAEYRLSVKGPMNHEIDKEKFVPGEVGIYTIVYSLWIKEKGDNLSQFEEVEEAKREYVVNVADTTKPTVIVEWNLKDSYDKNASVLIPMFSADDVSGINFEASNVRISSDHYTKTIYAKDFAKQLEIYNGWKDEEARIAAGETIDTRKYPDAGSLYVTFRYDEKYTVTYTVFDKSNSSNSTVVTHSIKVGDLVSPVLDIDDDIIPSIVRIGTILTIDTSKIQISDNKTEMSIADLVIVVKNTSTNTVLKNIHANADNGKFEYNIETAGKYTITFSARDASGNKGTFERIFVVNEDIIKPVIIVDDDIVNDELSVGSVFTIDTGKIQIFDNMTEMSINDLEIFIKNTSTNTVIKNIHEGANNGKFEYSIEDEGVYLIVFLVQDASGNLTSVEKVFTAKEHSNGVVIGVVIGISACIFVGLIIFAVLWFGIYKKSWKDITTLFKKK